MKKLLTLLLAVASMAMFAGCVQMQSDTTINKDGSGTAFIKASVSKIVAESMEEMKELDMGDGQEMPDFSEIDKDELEKKAKKHGVKIKNFKNDTVDGKPTFEIEVEFEDLKGLSYVLGSMMGEGSSDGMGIYDAGDGNFVLKPAEYDFGEPEKEEEAEETTAPEDMTPEQMQKQMAIMGKMMQAMAEVDVVMKITVPGDIVESNAPETDGRTSIWTINANNMMSGAADMTPNIVFSGKGLKIKALTE